MKLIHPVALFLSISALSLMCAGCASVTMEMGERITDKDRKEVGTIHVFEVKAKVETDRGVETQTERVTAEITGHKSIGGGVNRVYKAVYEHEGEMTFHNISGDRLVLENPGPLNLNKLDYVGAYDAYVGGDLYLKGESKRLILLFPELRKLESLEKYGFRLIRYSAPLIFSGSEDEFLMAFPK